MAMYMSLDAPLAAHHEPININSDTSSDGLTPQESFSSDSDISLQELPRSSSERAQSHRIIDEVPETQLSSGESQEEVALEPDDRGQDEIKLDQGDDVYFSGKESSEVLDLPGNGRSQMDLPFSKTRPTSPGSPGQSESTGEDRDPLPGSKYASLPKGNARRTQNHIHESDNNTNTDEHSPLFDPADVFAESRETSMSAISANENKGSDAIIIDSNDEEPLFLGAPSSSSAESSPPSETESVGSDQDAEADIDWTTDVLQFRRSATDAHTQKRRKLLPVIIPPTIKDHSQYDYKFLSFGERSKSQLLEFDPYAECLELEHVQNRASQISPSIESSPTATEIKRSRPRRDDLTSSILAKKLDRPYLSLKARAFMRHLGDWEAFKDHSGALIHVDFDEAEEKHLRKLISRLPSSHHGSKHIFDVEMVEQMIGNSRQLELRGRTALDCFKFIQDYIANPAPTPNDRNTSIVLKSGKSHSRRALRQNFSMPASITSREIAPTSCSRSLDICSRSLVHSFKALRTSPLSSGDVLDISFSPEGDRFVMASLTVLTGYNRPGNLWLGNIHTDSMKFMKGHEKDDVFYTVTDAKFMRDGRHIFSCSHDKTVKVWDLDGCMKSSIGSHRGHLNCLSAHTTNERIIASACQDSNVYLYDVDAEGKATTTYTMSVPSGKNKDLPVSTVAFGQGFWKDTLYAGYETKLNEEKQPCGALGAFDASTGQLLQAVIPSSTSHASIFTHPTVPFWVTGSAAYKDSKVRIYTSGENRMVIECDSPQRDLNYVTMSPCGGFVTSSGTDNATCVFDLRRPDYVLHSLAHEHSHLQQADPEYEEYELGVNFASWNPIDNGQTFVTGGTDGSVRLWDVSKAEPLIKVLATHDSAVTSGKFSPDGTKLCIGQQSGKMTMYDLGHTGEATPFSIDNDDEAQEDDVGGIEAARQLIDDRRVEIRDTNGFRVAYGL